jgi:hypothetical protein
MANQQVTAPVKLATPPKAVVPSVQTPQVVQLAVGKPEKADDGMGGLEFTSSVIGSLAWPIAAVVIAIIFRAQIAGLLKRIRQASWGDTKVNFADELDKIENDAPSVNLLPDAQIVQQLLDNQPIDDRFQALLAISPNAAIMDSWRGIEKSIHDLAVEHSLSENIDKMRVDQLALGLKSKGHLTVKALKTISEMRNLRNRAAHNAEITVTDALRFDELARRMKKFLED